jgi:transcriptional regulator with GAF, ATPase, and Fis domain
MTKFAPKKTLIISHSGQTDTLTYNKFKLVVVEGPGQGREFVMDRDLVRIGTSRENDLVLLDETVSRKHCEIGVTEEGYLIRDLGSTNGTAVEHCWIKEALLHPGAHIRLGGVVLAFEPLQERVEIPLYPQESFGRLLGKSPKMRALFYLADRVAARDTTVLITGETGTGKGLLAEELHTHSPRCAAPFLVVDCATIPTHLMETELFGHVKGAFTGAVDSHVGAFEATQGGTLLLDEIGELPAALQPKLLRVLEQHEIKKVGATEKEPVDVRILAATNRNLQGEVEAGRFREDLFFRLSVFELKVPPVREHTEDIPLLARQFLQTLTGDSERRFDANALRFLMRHDWPGNVRELRNVIERVAHLVDERVIDQTSLMSATLSGQESASCYPHSGSRGYLTFNQAKDQAEYEYLIDLLRQHNNNISAAAKTAGIHRQSLHRLLRKNRIKISDIDDLG